VRGSNGGFFEALDDLLSGWKSCAIRCDQRHIDELIANARIFLVEDLFVRRAVGPVGPQFSVIRRMEDVLKLDPSAFVADKELFDALGKRSTAIHCDEDRILFRKGEVPSGLYILRSGCVVLTMTSPSGDLLLSTPVSEGSLLGLPGFVGDRPYSLTAEAQKGSVLGCVSRADFSDLMLTNPALSLKLLAVLAAEVRSARSAISES
jgi:CRP-like cAMP-binding protein